MIGGDYFQLRAQLGTALFSLSTLAHDLDAPPETLRTLQDLHARLREPFLFVVVGEVGAGKSSLLNAMFGRDFCRVDVLPATDRIYVFKHGEPEADVTVTERLTECYRSNAFLRDFNIVDTPGTNTIVPEHQTISERFLPLADLVLFVFSVTNPWAATAWEFLNLVHKKWLKNVVFVLQQTDLRDETEISSVVQHLEHTALERLGTRFPVFGVSAKKAFLARTTTAADKEKLWSESRFAALEDHINQTVAHGEARLSKLRTVGEAAQVILREFSAAAQTALALLQTDEKMITQLRLHLGERKQQSIREVGSFVLTLAQAHSSAQKEGEQSLVQTLSLTETINTLLCRSGAADERRQERHDQSSHSVEKQLGNALKLLEADLKNIWHFVIESVRRDHIHRVEPAPTLLLQTRAALLQRIETTLLEWEKDPEVTRQVQQLFASSEALSDPTAAGRQEEPAHLLASRVSADVALTSNEVCAGRRAMTALLCRGKIMTTFRNTMERRRTELIGQVETNLRHALDGHFEAVTAAIQPLQEFAATQRRTYESISRRAADLAATFEQRVAELR